MSSTEQKPLRVGVVGAGNISPVHGDAWRELGAELYVYSLEFSERFADRHGATVVDSLDALLQRVDIVDVVTPTDVHAEIATAALNAGKHVICEKPLAGTAAEARALIELAEAKGVHLYPAHVVRYFPQFAAAHDAVAKGELGRMAVQRFRRGGSHPTAAWYLESDEPGAVILDLMIHDLDQAVWMAGPATSVYATGTQTTEPNPIQTYHVVLTHENGTISHCRGLWGAPGLGFWFGFHLAGTTGMLTYDSRLETGYRLTGGVAATNASYIPATTPGESPYSAEVAELTAAIQGGQAPRVSARDGLAAIELCEAAYQSLRTGERVTLPSTTHETTTVGSN